MRTKYEILSLMPLSADWHAVMQAPDGYVSTPLVALALCASKGKRNAVCGVIHAGRSFEICEEAEGFLGYLVPGESIEEHFGIEVDE